MLGAESYILNGLFVTEFESCADGSAAAARCLGSTDPKLLQHSQPTTESATNPEPENITATDRGSAADYLATVGRLLDLQKTQALTELERLDFNRAMTFLANELQPIARKAVKRLQGARRSGNDQLLEEQAPLLVYEAIWRFRGDNLGQLGKHVGKLVRNKSIEWRNLHCDYSRHAYGRDREFVTGMERLALELQRQPTDDEVYDLLGWSDTIRKNHVALVTKAYLRSHRGSDNNTVLETADERYRWVENEVRRLPVGEATALQYLFLNRPPLSVSETARILGLSEFEVENYYRGAVKRLKKRLELQPAARHLLEGDGSAS